MDDTQHTIFKAMVLGDDLPASVSPGESNTAFSDAGALEPPYDPEMLCRLMEHSNSLRQNIDAYATNIDGFGHRLEPAIDLEAENADELVAESIYLEALAEQDTEETDGEHIADPGMAEGGKSCRGHHGQGYSNEQVTHW